MQVLDLEIKDMFRVENVVVDHLSKLLTKFSTPILNIFLDKQILETKKQPWYACIVNDRLSSQLLDDLDSDNRKKFYKYL